MNNYDATVWFLHRKLFHRYMKFHKFFDKATESVPEYRQLLEAPSPPPAPKKINKETTPTPSEPQAIIDLISESSSEAEEEGSEEGSVSGYEDI